MRGKAEMNTIVQTQLGNRAFRQVDEEGEGGRDGERDGSGLQEDEIGEK